VRGSFAACIDVRALCHQGGSCPFWYDAAGALPVARARGLRVVVTSSDGKVLVGSDHPIRTPVALVVAVPEVVEIIVEAVRSLVCPTFVTDLPIVQQKETTYGTSVQVVN